MTQTLLDDSAVLGTGNGLNTAAVLGGEKRFKKALSRFVGQLQELINEHFEQYDNLRPNEVSIDSKGKKYIRIVITHVNQDWSKGQRFVHCFINRENGDILKAASWKAPAKHPRGNIYQPNAMEAVTVYRAKYLK
jgi:hypothetical protein